MQARDRLATLRREMQNTARPTRQMRANLAQAHKAALQASISKVGLEEAAVALGLLNSAGLDGGKGGTAFSATLR